MQDSQGQILALAFQVKSLKPFKLFTLRVEAEVRGHPWKGTSGQNSSSASVDPDSSIIKGLADLTSKMGPGRSSGDGAGATGDGVDPDSSIITQS